MKVSPSLVRSQAQSLHDEVIRIRREIHQYPELAYQEVLTSDLVATRLKELGIEVQRNIGKTGVVGVLGSGDSTVLAIRCDMDALPIQESTSVPYASRNPGVMHACGHDANVAIVVGAAMILSALKDRLEIGVKLIFQPSEETIPSGAGVMIEKGVLEDPHVMAIVGIHVDPQIEAGKVGIRRGVMNASSDTFEITILGQGGHAAYPHRAVDAIVIAAGFIQEVQKIISRRVNPLDSAVITIGTIEGGSATNIIADRTRLTGTVRTLDMALRESMPTWIEQILSGVVNAHGARYELTYQRGEPVLSNDIQIACLAEEIAVGMLGPENVVHIQRPVMGADDFAYYLERIPGFMVRLGIKNEEKGAIYPLHHPEFTIDEDALPVGAAMLAGMALNFDVDMLSMKGD